MAKPKSPGLKSQSNPLDGLSKGIVKKIDNLVGAVPIQKEELANVIVLLKSIELNDDRLKILEEEKLPYLFNSSQLAELLDITPSVKTRLAFIVMLGPRLINPRAKVDHFIGLFRYSEEKEKVQEVLKARSDALNANLFRQPAFILNGNGNSESNTNSTETLLKNKPENGKPKSFMGLVARERVTKPTGKSQIGPRNLSTDIEAVIDEKVTTETMSISRPDQRLVSLGSTKETSISTKKAEKRLNPTVSLLSPSLQREQVAKTLTPLQTDFDLNDGKNGESEVTVQVCNKPHDSILANTTAVPSVSVYNDNSNGRTSKKQKDSIEPIIQSPSSSNLVQRMIKSYSKVSPSSSQSVHNQPVEIDTATGNINNISNIHAHTVSCKQNEVNGCQLQHSDKYGKENGNAEEDKISEESWRVSKTQKSVKSLAEDYSKKPRPSILRRNSSEKGENGIKNVSLSLFGTRDNEIKSRPVSGQYHKQNSNVNSSSSSNMVDLSVYQHMAAEGPVDCNEEGIPLFRFDELVRMNFVKKYEGIKQSELIYSMVNEDFLEHFGSTKDEFRAQPSWRQVQKKKALLLF